MATALAVLLTATACHAEPTAMSPDDARSPLKLVRKIDLPGVAGRIDHLALDPIHNLLFVAEYGNGSIDVVDLAANHVVGRISGLHEPQGVGVSADGNQFVVACGDGTVHFYATRDRRELGSLSLGDDADNVRIDPRNGHTVIGFGNGGLAVVDMGSHHVVSRLTLSGHPEGFSLVGAQVLINIPDRGEIVKGNIDTGQITASWSTGLQRMNFPIAIDPTGRSVAVAFRLPTAVQVRDADNGQVHANVGACGDADDLFFETSRLYLICGSGAVDVRSAIRPETAVQRVSTANGARTGLFDAQNRILYLAVPKRGQDAAIWVMHPAAK